MNQNSLKAAIKKYGAIKDETELINALTSDEKKFSETEIAEIKEAILNGEKSDENPFAAIDYSKLQAEEVFDELEGEKELKPSDTFKAYNEEFAKLIDVKQYSFFKYNAVGQFRRNKRGANVLVGIKLLNEKPKQTTRMEKRFIKDLNSQIYNTDNRPESTYYYLIAK